MCGYAPQERENTVRLPRLMGACGWLLNFTVREHDRGFVP